MDRLSLEMDWDDILLLFEEVDCWERVNKILHTWDRKWVYKGLRYST